MSTNPLNIADEYLIEFDTQINPGYLVATRVRIDTVTLKIDSTRAIRVDLCDHPLYSTLKQYVERNPGS